MEEIEELERRIEALRERIERSRKLTLAGRAAAVAGGALIFCFVAHLLEFTAGGTVIAIALTIGGVVLSGSSRASTEELARSLKQAEAEWNAAIDALKLVQVRNRP